MMKEETETKDRILGLIRGNQDRIRAYGVCKVGLFGSFVRDEQNLESDIDLLVEFEQGKKTFDNFMHLSFFLEEVLKHPVEIVTTDALSPYIGPHILKEVEYVTLSS
jgi:predicted nucleotidyltransferase